MAEDTALVPELSAFERIKHRDEDGAEYWYARELMTLLGYSKWQNFQRVIEEAIAVVGQEGPDALASNFTATSDDSPRLKPGAAGMTLVCRPTPLVQFHPVERALLTDSTLGWHRV
jgi:hypothetical protein